LGEISTSAELVHDLLATWEVVNRVADLGVGLERKDLAVDPKAADAVSRAVFQRFHQSLGIPQADVGNLGQGVLATELLHRRSRGRAELDRLVSKDAAQSQANHGSASRFSSPTLGGID
jgi:hypothetical protein